MLLAVAVAAFWRRLGCGAKRGGPEHVIWQPNAAADAHSRALHPYAAGAPSSHGAASGRGGSVSLPVRAVVEPVATGPPPPARPLPPARPAGEVIQTYGLDTIIANTGAPTGGAASSVGRIDVDEA